MTDVESKKAAKAFAEYWQGRGDEKSETQKYWNGLLHDVLGVENITDYIIYEKRVLLNNTSFIDAFISRGRDSVLIEQKSLGIDLNKEEKQSDGTLLKPYEQGKRYADWVSNSERPQWVIACNFGEIHIHDLDRPKADPVVIKLEDLPAQYSKLEFLRDVRKAEQLTRDEVAISKEAGTLVRKLYDALTAKYKAVKKELDAADLHNLNKLCVQLVFCFYAEDAGVFGSRKDMFLDYIKGFNVQNVRKALLDLFKQLNTPPDQRDPFDDTPVAAFPYVNGGLFDGVTVIPSLDAEIVRIITEDCCAGFDWSTISPVIFGAIFESTMNQETRRSGGMHYTSVENIRKVIKPLFLDALEEEFQAICAEKISLSRKKKLTAFQDKLASLKFLDPACGSGNFLTQAYIELRRLENRTLEEMMKVSPGKKKGMQGGLLIAEQKVSITQFYGIEINDFAVSVAKTALWIAESQMMNVTESIIGQTINFLPLTTQAGIVEGNALQMDWNDVCPRNELSYIMGNPPFYGARLMTKEQKNDVNTIFKGWKNIGNLDYVCCWYKKAADFIRGTFIRAALVSTNSVTQGESVGTLWKPLIESGVHIVFAYRTFRWDSESFNIAHVHVVIIGFSTSLYGKARHIYDGAKVITAKNISPYLIDAPDVFIESRNKPLCTVPSIGIGNKPIDDGNYLFKEEEMREFLKKEPKAEKYFRPWYGSYEFINRKPRYCLWLGDCPPNELRKMPECMKRIEAVKTFRLNSKSAGTVKLADKPTHFHVENMPKGEYIVIPETSSERRQYTPMGYMDSRVLCSNALRLMPSATLYHFGILTSSVHMAWMRTVCGRLEMRYRYSKDIVYNNFPWPTLTDEQKKKIKQTAQGILDAREKFPDSSLADLYDPLTMPPELLKAHEANDHAVKAAYGYPQDITEPEIVADLFKRYQALTSK